jgi:hypothetical protein
MLSDWESLKASFIDVFTIFPKNRDNDLRAEIKNLIETFSSSGPL